MLFMEVEILQKERIWRRAPENARIHPIDCVNSYISTSSTSLMHRHLPATLLLACLALAFLAYFPGASGGFLFDDTVNIVDNSRIRIQSLDFPALKQAALSGDAGTLGRPLSVLSFALNYYFNGLNPFYFKLTNIIIHLLNGICVYVLTFLVLETCRQRDLAGFSQSYARWVGLAVASAWLLHPLNLTGVLYVVQRMTSLAALFTLLGLISYLHGRRQLASGKAGWGWILAGFALFTPLAMFSKENGALLPVFMLLVEFIFYRFQAPTPGARRALAALFGISVLLPFVALMIYSVVNPQWLTGGYRIRDFTLTERLMTEARVLWFYIQNIIAPNLSQLGIYHDDIPISKSLFEPASTFFACIGILLLAAFAFLVRTRHPLAAFGILFFLIGHSIESSVLALELAHEHRNYLPIYGLLLIMFYYLLYPLRHIQSLRARQLLAPAFVLMLAGVTFMRATQWGDLVVMNEMAVANHPNSIRSNLDLAVLYAVIPPSSQIEAEENYARAYEHFAQASKLSLSDTLGLFGLIGMNSKRRLPIEETWVRALSGRIERYPFAPSTGNALASLEKCMTKGDCTHPPEVMATLLQAAMRNPTLQGKAKAQVLFTWSDFLFRIKHDRDAAAKAAYAAAAAYPNELDNQLTLITMLINMGKLGEAKTRIEETRLLDRRQTHTAALDEFDALVASRSQKGN